MSLANIVKNIDSPNQIKRLRGQISIPENSDLNNYNTIGEYCCNTSATATTVSNTPIDGVAFRLTVESSLTSNNYIKQTFTPFNSTKYYVRVSTNTGSTWNSWIDYSDNSVKSHASTATTYGKATTANYGHVKISDTYNSTISDGDVAGGTAASQKALYNAWNNRPPIDHASSATTYGRGSSSNYGHVKVNDTYTSSISGGNAAGGVAASQLAVYNAYANRAPISHASSATTYGKATTANYGHVKITNDWAGKGTAANGIAASAYAVYQAQGNIGNWWSTSITFPQGQSSTVKSIPNNTNTNITSFTIPKSRIYIIFITAEWASNGTGRRSVWLSDSATGSQYNRFTQKVDAAVPDAIHVSSACFMWAEDTDTKVYVNVRQTSGGALNLNRWGVRGLALGYRG